MWIYKNRDIGGVDWNVDEFESMIREKIGDFFCGNFLLAFTALGGQACSNRNFRLVLVETLFE